MYRVIVKFDRTWRRFLGRRWRIVDQWETDADYNPVADDGRCINMASHKRRIIGSRCNPLEILKEWQQWRRSQNVKNSER